MNRLLILTLIFAVALPACGSLDSGSAVRSAVVDMFVAVDERQWPAVEASFAEEVRLALTARTISWGTFRLSWMAPPRGPSSTAQPRTISPKRVYGRL